MSVSPYVVLECSFIFAFLWRNTYKSNYSGVLKYPECCCSSLMYSAFSDITSNSFSSSLFFFSFMLYCHFSFLLLFVPWEYENFSLLWPWTLLPAPQVCIFWEARHATNCFWEKVVVISIFFKQFLFLEKVAPEKELCFLNERSQDFCQLSNSSHCLVFFMLAKTWVSYEGKMILCSFMVAYLFFLLLYFLNLRI